MSGAKREYPFAYRRVLLKVSGEMLMGDAEFGLNPSVIDGFCDEIADVAREGLQMGIVVGGGNIFRGTLGEQLGISRVSGDNMGMLATLINSLALQARLEDKGIPTRVMSAINVDRFAEPYIRRRALRHLEKGRTIILAAGTGNPFFSTDTAAALRATEIGAEILLKGTKVDGVFSDDPVIYPDAIKFDNMSFIDVLNKHLRVMDSTATSLCMDNKIPIVVFNLHDEGNLRKALEGQKIGTLVN
ncbi:MAG: UMP kinase [candidate division Zixibacteria bacterium]|nr:UMP kinase [candidate division Zixibacteria bacterium]